jgi:hypothetical protein
MDHLLGWKSWLAVLATPGGTEAFRPGAMEPHGQCTHSKSVRAIAGR